MKPNFYLKKEENGKSLIYIQLRINGHKVVLSAKQNIEPHYWDHNKQRAYKKIATKENGLFYLNSFLDRINKEVICHITKLRYRGYFLKDDFNFDQLKTDVEDIVAFKTPSNESIKTGIPEPLRIDQLIYYTRKEAAEFFKINPHSMYKWEKDGIITPSIHVNGRPRYTMEDIEKVCSEKSIVKENEKRPVGRPKTRHSRPDRAAGKRTHPGEERYLVTLGTNDIKAMKTIAAQKYISIKDAFAQAIALYKKSKKTIL